MGGGGHAAQTVQRSYSVYTTCSKVTLRYLDGIRTSHEYVISHSCDIVNSACPNIPSGTGNRICPGHGYPLVSCRNCIRASVTTRDIHNSVSRRNGGFLAGYIYRALSGC